jgi:predicted transcriptional regulator
MEELHGVARSTLADLLIFGDNRAGNICERTGYTPEATSTNLVDMEQMGYVDNKGDGVYQLREKGEKAAQTLLLEGFNPYDRNQSPASQSSTE